MIATTQLDVAVPPALEVAAPLLDEGDVHLWTIPLDSPANPFGLLLSYLAPDELKRMRRFVFRRDREQFIVARGYVRSILARYAGCDPSEIEFGYSTHGKPFLSGPFTGDDLTFNVSHTRGIGLCAVSRGRALGVDVEEIRAGVDILGIARTTFSPAERASIEALPPEHQPMGFFNCWTRKEAYIKARGDGLSYPLDAFDVSLTPGEPAALLHSRDGEPERQRWTFHALDAGPGYAAALVAERPFGRMQLIGNP